MAMNNNNNDKIDKIITQSGDSKKQVSAKLKNSLQKLALLAISAIYILNGIFSFSKKNASIIEILGDIGLSIAIGVGITTLLRSMGIKDGRSSQLFNNSLETYGNTKKTATKYFHKLHAWCEYKNAQELESAKKEIILSAGLSWKGYKYGYYETHPEKLSEEQKKQIEKANTCKILKIQAKDLLSDSNYITTIGGKQVGGKFGRSEMNYNISHSISDVFSRVALGIICGLYALTPITDKNALAGVLWHAAQITLWLTFGLFKYADAKYFMEYEYRQTHIIAKTEYLNEFITTMEYNAAVVDEFDEEQDVDIYIQDFIDKKMQQQQQLKEVKEK